MAQNLTERAAEPPANRSIGSVLARAVVPPTDQELLARCREHDVEAWNLLVERYERLIYSVALRNGATEEDAADITQTTFVELIDSLDRLRDETRLASWLMTVARRRTWRVRTIARRTVSTDVMPEVMPERHEDPFADWGKLSAIHDALGELGDPCRDLLMSLYFDPEEPSYEDIAGRMGRAIGGIGPLRGRCLGRLREILGEEWNS